MFGKRVGLLGLLAITSLLFLCAPATLKHTKATDVQSPWVTGQPTFKQEATYTVATNNPAPGFTYGNNLDCQNNAFSWRPEKNFGFINYQQAGSYNLCAFTVPSGTVESTFGSPYLQKNGTSIAGRISNFGFIQAIPGSNNVAEFISSASISGMYLRFIDDAYSGLQLTKNSDGTIAYKTTKTPTALLTDRKGNRLNIQVGSMSFSEDGKWMVIDAANSGMMRINTQTHEILPFMQGFTYGSGLNPDAKTGISNDGRYAVVASSPTNYFKIFDLSTCKPNANTSATYDTCQSRDLTDVMKVNVPTYKNGVAKVRFISSDTFTFYADYNYVSPSNRTIGQFSLTTPNVAYSKLDYLGLGDSFASGEGAYNYRLGTNIKENHCHTSELSYPYLLAQNTVSSQSVACSGAKIKDVITVKVQEYNSANPQATGKENESFNNEIYNGFQPGYRGQINFVKDNQPKIVTLSAGGNDIGFSKVLEKCVSSIDDCYPTYEDRAEIVSTINNTYPKLVDMYRLVKKSTVINGKVYVIGYPQIAKQDGNCGLNVHFTNNEIIFGNQLVTYLNTVVKMAADQAGVAYVDAEQAFAGHKLCETTSDNIAVNGLTFGEGGPIEGFGPFARESYHPTAKGHQLFKDVILNKTNGLSLTMPVKVTAASVFPVSNDIALLQSAPKTNRVIKNTYYNDAVIDDVVYRNTLATVGLNADEYSLKPSTSYGLALYSNPISLGSATTDATGKLSKQVTIPRSIEPGYHTLHISGVNSLDEPIEITKIIYVAESKTDLDGNGILDSDEKCVGVTPVGIDFDGDGTDDACDNVISDAPLVIPPPEPEPPVIVKEPTQSPEIIDVLPIEVPLPIIVTLPIIEDEINKPEETLDVPATKEIAGTLPPQTNSRAAVTTLTNRSTTQTASSEQPNTLVTQVAGISDTKSIVKMNDEAQPTAPQTTQINQTPELAVLIAGVGLLLFGVAATIWKLRKI